jgi:hypothetical protein
MLPVYAAEDEKEIDEEEFGMQRNRSGITE